MTTPVPKVLLTLDEALAKLLGAITPRCAEDPETVSTLDALGRVLVEDVRSAIHVPPEDNSAMDGYAMRAADVPAAGTKLPVSQRIAAGHPPVPLQAGTAARIFTGAQVPAGADVVVMQEQCTADGEQVAIDIVPRAGDSIRRRGEDVAEGAVVLRRGQRLTPQALGMAASVGAGELKVARRPRVALFSTGDELVMPGQPLPAGAIYNSNRFLLRGLLQALGCDVLDLGIVPDELDATRQTLRRAAHRHDLILTSGGVSVGEEDHLKPAVEAEGAVDFWQMAMKPGKPLAFGHVRRPDGSGTYFVGLPGNPVSTFVTFVLAVRPLLLKLQGVEDLAPRVLQARADFDWPRADRRREFLRVKLNDQGGLDLFDNQGSGVLTSTVWGDGLVDTAPSTPIVRGQTVKFLPFSSLLS